MLRSGWSRWWVMARAAGCAEQVVVTASLASPPQADERSRARSVRARLRPDRTKHVEAVARVSVVRNLGKNVLVHGTPRRIAVERRPGPLSRRRSGGTVMAAALGQTRHPLDLVPGKVSSVADAMWAMRDYGDALYKQAPASNGSTPRRAGAARQPISPSCLRRRAGEVAHGGGLLPRRRSSAGLLRRDTSLGPGRGRGGHPALGRR